VTVTAVGGGDLIGVGEVGAHARGDSLLADIEVQEPGQLGCLGELAGGFLEQTDAHHAAVQIHQHVGGEVHVESFCVDRRQVVSG
jgi:hypothetical protein